GIRLYRMNNTYQAQLRNGSSTLNLSPTINESGPVTMYIFRDSATEFRAGIDSGDGIEFFSRATAHSLMDGETITLANSGSVPKMYIGVEVYPHSTWGVFDNLRVETIPVPEPVTFTLLGSGCLA